MVPSITSKFFKITSYVTLISLEREAEKKNSRASKHLG